MATAKAMPKVKPKVAKPKLDPEELKAENEKLKKQLEKYEDTVTCNMCGKPVRKENFHACTDPMIHSGVARICKACAKKIAERFDGEYYHEPTKESVQLALRYLDKPFLDAVWDASLAESLDKSLGKTKNNVATAYFKNISMRQYYGLTYADSDMFKTPKQYFEDELTEEEIIEGHQGQDTYQSFLKNKEDVIRLLDYDPFEQEPIRDQPFLYSQLLGMLDASEDANEDMMRVSAAISIVRGFLQMSKIDDTIAKLMGDITQLANNSATIKSLQDSKQKLSTIINNMAAENCLSLKNSKTKTKGEDTFSGRLRKIRELNLRDSDLNGYDLQTCKGMQQVADISMQAIIKGLRLTEDEMSDIVATQRKRMHEMDLETKGYREAVRILLKENLDLRDTLDDKGLLKGNLVDLEEFVGTYLVPKKDGVPDGQI